MNVSAVVVPRILTVSSLYPSRPMPIRGIFVEDRLRLLVRTGRIEARVIAPIPWFPFRQGWFGARSKFAAVPREDELQGIHVAYPRYFMVPKAGAAFQLARYYSALRNEVERRMRLGMQFDLIDAQYLYPDGAAAARLAQHLGKPICVSALGTDLNVIAGMTGPGRAISSSFAQIDRLIVVSAALGARAKDMGMKEDRIVFLRNGVDLSLFKILDGTRWRALMPVSQILLLSVGNLVPLKGHDIVIRALTHIPEAGLLVAGEGPERARLLALARRLGVSERVRLVGLVPHTELAALYSAADLLILASQREGWPNVLLESMACGTPVVASNVGGVAEFVTDPVAGQLLDQRSPEGIAKAVRQALASRADRTQVRAFAQRFEWNEVITQQVALYEEVIDEARRRKGTELNRR
jgi:glycosyltransferase involved in cell wall biosynthesis